MDEIKDKVMQQLMGEIYSTNRISSFVGPSQYTDNFGTSYISLWQGVTKKEGEYCNVLYDSKSDAMYRQFEFEFLRWLDGRNKIIWREFPQVMEFEIWQVDLAARHLNWERIVDGIDTHEVPDVSKVKRFGIYCRLTAYRD